MNNSYRMTNRKPAIRQRQTGFFSSTFIGRWLLLMVAGSLAAGTAPAQVVALTNAHAHNDYAHPRPLLDALAHGFTSIEADIHLISDELYVAHDLPQSPQAGTTLKELYLEPLRLHIRQNKGMVYAGHLSPIYLMIDIKSDAEATYRKLVEQLRDYQDILQTKDNEYGLVRVVISGNRAVQAALQDPSRLVSIDGRPEDISRHFNSEYMPIISEHYRKVIHWGGEGEIPAKEFAKLKKLADEVHAQNKKLRLWASPENEKVWEVLLKAGVDFINTDQLDLLEQFLHRKQGKYKATN
jgi:hypothetical protein